MKLVRVTEKILHRWKRELAAAKSAGTRFAPGSGNSRDEEHMLSGGRFGTRKVWHRLKEHGVACSLRKVTRLMRQEGLKSRCFRVRRSITVADESAPPVPNVLNREFVAEKPDEKWVSDITQCRTRTGWIYLAVVLDLCSRRVVGWAVSRQADRALVIAAFQRAADADEHAGCDGDEYTYQHADAGF